MQQAQLNYYLIWASEKGQVEVVRLLLENGANVHYCNDYSLKEATYKGHVEVVKLLIKYGADITTFHDFEKEHFYMMDYKEIYDLIRGDYEF